MASKQSSQPSAWTNYKTYLSEAGLLDSTSRGHFKITPRGQQVLESGRSWKPLPKGPSIIGRLIGARLLVTLAESEEMPQHVAHRLFDSCAYLPMNFNVTACDARTLFLYLFNIWAVLIARAPDGLKTLAASQDEMAVCGVWLRDFLFLLEGAEQHKAVMRFFTFRGLMLIGPLPAGCLQLALNVSAWHGSLQIAIRGIAENLCSWRAFRRLTVMAPRLTHWLISARCLFMPRC